jgi:YopX protein
MLENAELATVDIRDKPELMELCNGYEITTFFHIAPHDPNMELMQFAGLRDKNDKEVYEGDICKVVDEHGPWNVAAQEMHSLDAFHFWNHVSENIEDGVSYEIIGNVYENQNLI